MRRLAALLLSLPMTLVAVAACGDGSQRGLRQLIDEVQAVRTTAEQGDLTSARQQLDDLRVTAGVLRGRGRITAEDLAAFRHALDRVETELGSVPQSVLAAATTTVSVTTTVPPATTTAPAPPTTVPSPPHEEPGKRRGKDDA